ncbi:MAG: trypsin-like peptidase domain-containing protein [Candidatus Levybacteria bacterium]|nr:trypsin-like peptidase domain-containing protein [Candidatus Levybacteria bacterium]
MRKLIVLVAFLVAFLAGWNVLTKYAPQIVEKFKVPKIQGPSEKVKIVSEESVVTDIVEKVTPSVVTVGIEQRIIQIDPFDPFSFFRRPRGTQKEQDIASGFIASADGLIVTNKHVVQSQGKYKVITSDGKKYDVEKIYRDPTNDIAILKISATGLKPLTLGDSSKLKVGQLAVAVGTPLGEFRGTVTKGIISGLGRGITTGSPFEEEVTEFEDVIQTDAAINPGNSGGPLLNSSAQAVGVNVAVASGAENIGFAIPINVVKEALTNFSQTGGFSRPYLGVGYQMISRQVAIRNELPEGAYVEQVVEGSAAEKADIQEGDIITKIDGVKLSDANTLATVISKKKVGDTITITVWRSDKEKESEGKTLDLKATLQPTPDQ